MKHLTPFLILFLFAACVQNKPEPQPDPEPQSEPAEPDPEPFGEGEAELYIQALEAMATEYDAEAALAEYDAKQLPAIRESMLEAADYYRKEADAARKLVEAVRAGLPVRRQASELLANEDAYVLRDAADGNRFLLDDPGIPADKREIYSRLATARENLAAALDRLPSGEPAPAPAPAPVPD